MIYNMFLNSFYVDINVDNRFALNNEIVTLNFIGNNSEVIIKTQSKMLDIFNDKKSFKLGKEQYKITIEEIKE